MSFHSDSFRVETSFALFFLILILILILILLFRFDSFDIGEKLVADAVVGLERNDRIVIAFCDVIDGGYIRAELERIRLETVTLFQPPAVRFFRFFSPIRFDDAASSTSSPFISFFRKFLSLFFPTKGRRIVKARRNTQKSPCVGDDSTVIIERHP